MTTVPPKRELERRLSAVEGFDDPTAEREQYRTPSPIAAHVVHLAGLHGDLECPVVDLGSGTGMLAIGTALAGAASVTGVEIDPAAVAVARENAASVAPDEHVEWVLGDATRPPVCVEDATVLMNPPFGAQRGARHADRAFLETAADLAAVSYSIHNRGSEAFVESFAADNGGEVTHAYAAAFEIPNQFDFHEDDSRTITTEVFRIVWDRP
ncbi:MAG: METTL5 family protein [Halanaeroarchaeum sp.]